MSLYNALFGKNPNSDQLLNVLGKTQGDFGRFRDVFIQDNYIVVHTRCGGGNREDYEHVFEDMSNHSWYSHNEDDDFDCTYANFYFRVPDEKTKTLIALMDQGHNPKEAWPIILDALKNK